MSSPLLARSGLSLARLASYIAIAEVGGLSVATQGDPVRQSLLSRQLKELEEFFGATLIERRRGVFRLTAAGRTLIDIARPSLIQLEDFERRCGGQSTEVHIGAGESVLVWLLTPKLKPLLAADSMLVLTLHNLQSETSEHQVTRLSLPALHPLETPLSLAWSRRQAAIRPFMAGLARMVASALAGEMPRAISTAESPRTPRRAAGIDRREPRS